jgi:hypothetical protein
MALGDMNSALPIFSTMFYLSCECEDGEKIVLRAKKIFIKESGIEYSLSCKFCKAWKAIKHWYILQ